MYCERLGHQAMGELSDDRNLPLIILMLLLVSHILPYQHLFKNRLIK